MDQGRPHRLIGADWAGSEAKFYLKPSGVEMEYGAGPAGTSATPQ